MEKVKDLRSTVRKILACFSNQQPFRLFLAYYNQTFAPTLAWCQECFPSWPPQGNIIHASASWPHVFFWPMVTWSCLLYISSALCFPCLVSIGCPICWAYWFSPYLLWYIAFLPSGTSHCLLSTLCWWYCAHSFFHRYTSSDRLIA